MRVSEKEIQKLFNSDEARDVSIWFVAERYRLIQGLIYPDGRKARISKPLDDRNLFLSFARLAAHGQSSEKLILSWVQQHGLLERQDNESLHPHVEDKNGEEQVNQKAMTIEEFRDETLRAYRALTLFQDIRNKDYEALRRRLRTEDFDYHDEHGNRINSFMTYVDDEPLPWEKALRGDYPDYQALEVANSGLEQIVESKISKVHLHFVMDMRHPRSVSSFMDLTYRPRLSPRCPDLRSALWYQFAALMSDKRPWKNCPICGIPFLQTRKDREVCINGGACQKEKERRKKS